MECDTKNCNGYTERGRLLVTRHPFNVNLKHLLPQTHDVKDCRDVDHARQCFLAGSPRAVFIVSRDASHVTKHYTD